MTGSRLRAWSSDISRGMGVTRRRVSRRSTSSNSARVRLVALADPDLVESLSRLGGTQAVKSSVTAAEVTASFSAEAEQPGCRFQIVRLHDQGGLGSVFVARDQELHREVALKQMKEEIASDKASRARFVFEAEITGNLEHPGVIPVYGKGEYDDGRPYYAMRFIHGDNLKDAVDRLYHSSPSVDANERRREFQKILRRFLVVCETMAYVHSRGVIHRDLKPRNILLGPYGETLIVDWGLAKVIGHHQEFDSADVTLRPPSSSELRETIAGEQRGTAAYMSPEQARGEVDRIGTATDVYSLGSTLYYVLTGKPPFNDRTVVEVLRKVGRGEFLPPREVNSRVERPLDAICCKAMALAPQDRYASCRLLADDIERALADLPVIAYAEPISTRTMRWLRRRRHWVAAAAAVLVLAVVGLTFLAWRLGKANTQTSDLLQMTRGVSSSQFYLASERLATYPNSENDRERISSEVLRVYTRLLEVFPDDPEIVFGTADAYRILGAIKRTTGQIPGSLSAYQSSIESFARLTEHSAKKHESRRGLVQDLIDRGELYRMNGSSTQAIKEFRLALEWVEKLKEDPLPYTYSDKKASVLIDLSDALLIQGDAAGSSDAAKEAIGLLDQPPFERNSSPHDAFTRWLIGLARINRGMAQDQLGHPAEAEKEFREALVRVGEVPEKSVYRVDANCLKGVLLARLGLLLHKQPVRREEAENCLDQSVAILKRLVTDHKENIDFRAELAIALNAQSRVQIQKDHKKDANIGCAAAEAALRKLGPAVQNNPQFASIMGETAAIKASLAQGQERQSLLNRAISHLERALELDPDRKVDQGRLADLRSGK